MGDVLNVLENRFVKAIREIEKLERRRNDLSIEEVKNEFSTQIVKQNGIACEIALIYADITGNNKCDVFDKLIKKCEVGK